MSQTVATVTAEDVDLSYAAYVATLPEARAASAAVRNLLNQLAVGPVSSPELEAAHQRDVVAVATREAAWEAYQAEYRHYCRATR